MAETLVDYEEFTEMVERGCIGWRHAIGRNNSSMLSRVNSVMFMRARRANGSSVKWEFSFAIRLGQNWVQVRHQVEPPRYDPLDPEAGEQSPREVATDVSTALLEKLWKAVSADEPKFV